MKLNSRVLLAILGFALPAFATVKVTTPTAGATVTSPVHYEATATSATCSKGVASMGVYVDNKLIYVVDAKSLNTEITLATGAEHTVVEEWDKCGGATVSTVNLTVVAPKPTVSISAGSASITDGTSTALTVKASNATKVTIAGSNGTSYTLATTGGTETVSPTTTTTYTATATGSGGTVSEKTTVTVKAAPAATVSISAKPASIVAGNTSTLTVTAANATTVTIAGSDGTSYTLGATGGTATVSPAASTTYTVTATGPGASATAKTTVTVTPAPAATVSISAKPTSIVSGNPSILTVTASNATAVTITGTDKSSYTLPATGGSQSVSPTSTTTYTATATGAGAPATASTTVMVTAAPGATVSISANPASIVAGNSSTLTVVATNATAVVVTGTDNTSYTLSATGGSPSVNPTSNTTYTATATGTGTTATASTTVTVAAKVVTSIALSPSPATFALNSTQQFTATATYNDNSTSDVTTTAAWTTANTSVATVDSSGLATPQASGLTSVSAAIAGVTGTAPVSVTIAPGTGVAIPTWHADTNRSGLNPGELSLNTSNVSPQTFGKLFSYLVDGYVYGEPLLMSNITINGAAHNVLYVATENDSVYAFDADNFGTGAPLWKVSLLQASESPDTGGPILPFEGVTSTPVIDPSSNTIYVLSKQGSGGSHSFRLNALDITTGAQKFGGPVTIKASVPATNSDAVNGVQTLTTSCTQRAALLLAYGNVYIGFGSCHSGWLLAYDAKSLTQTGVFNASPNLNGEGEYASAGGVWMGSGGPASDGDGSVYITTGNGPWDGQTAFSDSILKFSPTLQLQDYFTPDDYQYMDCADGDLAAGGLLLIPGAGQALAGGKGGKLYMVSTSNLGQEQANDAGATQTLWFENDLSPAYKTSCTDSTGVNYAMINSYEIFGTSAYFNGSVYLGITPTSSTAPAGVRQFTFSGNTLTPGSYTSPSVQENTRGTTPFLSANGTSDGILWMIDTGMPLQNSGSAAPTIATLHAYDASDLSNELYNSSTNPGDMPGYGIKFTSPVIANGKAYISTGHNLTTVSNPQGEIDVYGLQ